MGQLMNINDYQEYKTKLDIELKQTAQGFVRIGYLLRLARESNILEGSGYDNVNDFAKAEYGLDKTQVSRFIQINEKFSEGGCSDKLQSQYEGLGWSKLILMKDLPDVINEHITDDFSKSEINEIKREVEAEHRITDIEVMLENNENSDMELLDQITRQLFHDYIDLYIDAFYDLEKYETMELLAPAGQCVYTIRIPGTGKIMITAKADEQVVALINIRTNEKQEVNAQELRASFIKFLKNKNDLGCEQFWESIYGEEYPRKEKIAPEQPKKHERKENVPKKDKLIETKTEDKVEVQSQEAATKGTFPMNSPAELEEQVPGQTSVENHKDWLPKEYDSKKEESIDTTAKEKEDDDSYIDTMVSCAKLLIGDCQRTLESNDLEEALINAEKVVTYIKKALGKE